MNAREFAIEKLTEFRNELTAKKVVAKWRGSSGKNGVVAVEADSDLRRAVDIALNSLQGGAGSIRKLTKSDLAQQKRNLARMAREGSARQDYLMGKGR
jgi:hypothetical protein